MRTEFLRWTTGATLYAKPAPIDDDPTWDDDVMAGTEEGTTGQYAFAPLANDTFYEVFLQAGLDPVSGDKAVGFFPNLFTSEIAESASNRLEREGGPLDLVLEDTAATLPGLLTASTDTDYKVSRGTDDLRDIRFDWPDPDATITVTRAINNNATFFAATGEAEFLRTEGDLHIFRLTQDPDDRPADEATGFVTYKLEDGTTTRYLRLGIVSSSVDSANVAAQVTKEVWKAPSRTLTSFGSLIGAIWGYTTRTLSSSKTTTGSGPNLVIPTVKDNKGRLMMGKQVVVYNVDGTSLDLYDTTDENGQAFFQLQAGSYLFGVASSSGYAGHQPEPVTVNGKKTPLLTITALPEDEPEVVPTSAQINSAIKKHDRIYIGSMDHAYYQRTGYVTEVLAGGVMVQIEGTSAEPVHVLNSQFSLI